MEKKPVVWILLITTLTLGVGLWIIHRRGKNQTQTKRSNETSDMADNTNNTGHNTDVKPQKEVERVELSKKAKERNQRFSDFETFYKQAKQIFEPFKGKGERERYFQALYELCVCPGSRLGGRESRIVELFWGNRLFDKNEGICEDGRRSIHFESEAGATIFFFKNDDGYVSIQMYPAHTEHRHPIEDFIFWKMAVSPARLLKKQFQRRCWQAFMAYMEVTSIDGSPTLWQRIKVLYYRNFKHLVVDKNGLPPRYFNFLKKTGTWVLTVGFSGLVIFLLQLWLAPNPSEHQNIQDIRKSAIETENVIESLQHEVNYIKDNQDSLINLFNKCKLNE